MSGWDRSTSPMTRACRPAPAASSRPCSRPIGASRRATILKLTHEYLDPNRSVSNDGQTRYSIVYELTPIQYVQIRSGFRYSDGIPQNPLQHLKLGFVELHGFF